MSFLQQGVRLAARRMPKVIPPHMHAVFDYAFAGAFLFMAARQWKRNRRAAMASLLCGSASAVNALLTDYPGGISPVMSYRTHGRFDAGLAVITASTPQVLGFADSAEARFFSTQALAETLVTGMTDYNCYSDEQEEHPLKAVS